jgi:hypothetical protein
MEGHELQFSSTVQEYVTRLAFASQPSTAGASAACSARPGRTDEPQHQSVMSHAKQLAAPQAHLLHAVPVLEGRMNRSTKAS